MRIITGYISTVCLTLLLLKYPSRKAGFRNMNRLLWKLHKPVSGIFCISAFIHLILIIPVVKTRNIFIVMSGFAAFIMAFVLITLCHTMKDIKKKMLWHRIMSLVLLFIVAFHIFFYFNDFAEYKNNVKEISNSEWAGYIYARSQFQVLQIQAR